MYIYIYTYIDLAEAEGRCDQRGEKVEEGLEFTLVAPPIALILRAPPRRARVLPAPPRDRQKPVVLDRGDGAAVWGGRAGAVPRVERVAWAHGPAFFRVCVPADAPRVKKSLMLNLKSVNNFQE